MKANGDQAKIGAAMMKGETPFDLDKARKIFATFEDAAAKMPSLVPGQFEGRAAKRPPTRRFGRTWTTSRRSSPSSAPMPRMPAAKVTDLDGFKAAFGNIGKNDCGGCHEQYRIKKS